jgi:ATPase subunit of ABC transporter with duplicated ATPase domains
MPSFLLRASGVQFGYAEPLLSDVSFQLAPRSWTGVVGPNGAGKTTLLRLLSGELRPRAGAVSVRGRVAACAQVAPGEAASPGELQQRQIAAALRSGADALLLDEPTNHLDAQSREWLLRALPRFAGAGLVVSHDRALLDALTQATLRVANGTARLYPAPYSRARLLWEAEEAERRELRDAASARERDLRRRLGEARRDRQAADAQKSVARRMRSSYDSDARTLTARGRVEMAERRLGRDVEVLRRAHVRAEEELEGLAVAPELGRPVFAGFARCPRPFLLRTGSLAVGREDRVWLSGPNGAGKTALLREALAALPDAGEHAVYLPQEIDNTRAPLDAVRALPPGERGRVLTMVAALGVDPGRLLASAQPSPGEARKLVIATGLGRNAWALLLDEPTNHLDLPSVERLEAALRDYPGALLLITHDAKLAAATCTRRWAISPGAPVADLGL